MISALECQFLDYASLLVFSGPWCLVYRGLFLMVSSCWSFRVFNQWLGLLGVSELSV
jgi:hypothetical protein